MQYTSLADLESDHTNPYDASSSINACVIPEFVIQGALGAFFLLTWHWFLFILSVPITCYHVKLYMNKKHLIDVTEIFRVLDNEKRYRLIKIGFYLVLFFFVLYRLL
ncbi:hypothetical protein GIB67_018142 [Kingdonia uniflora]|uniref:Cornichon family protein n=1 Tax=Kingdonia uniflora TaxID=39325 RepID=A0A7J7NMX5_9MAGN|nr:hypothetical protein GIB67_018142 [Kingdonia uniflora]